MSANRPFFWLCRGIARAKCDALPVHPCGRTVAVMADAVVIPGRTFGLGAGLLMYASIAAEWRGAMVHRHWWTTEPPSWTSGQSAHWVDGQAAAAVDKAAVLHY